MTYPPGSWQGGPPANWQRQPGPPPGYGPPQQFPAPEPPRKRRGWLIALVLVLLLGVGALGFTAFVEPGFLLDRKPQPQSVRPDVTPAAEAFTGDFLDKVHAGDKPAAKAMFCPTSSTFHNRVDHAVTGKARFTLVPKEASRHGSPDYSYTGTFTGTVAGHPINDGSIILSSRDHGKSWCVETFSFDEPRTDPAKDTALVEKILARVGKGDRGVITLACKSGQGQIKDLASAVKRRAKLKLRDPLFERPVEGGVVEEPAHLVGTMAGKKVAGTLIIRTTDGGKSWCVTSFELVVAPR